MKKKIVLTVILIVLIIAFVGVAVFIVLNNKQLATPEEVFTKYISYISKQKYEKMYEMITEDSKNRVSKEDFIARNKNIYTGIDMKNMEIEIISVQEINSKQVSISYISEMDSSAGRIEFENIVDLYKNRENGYQIDWDSSLIFPDLLDSDKVKISNDIAERGEIVDRNGLLLAGKGEVSSVGIVPGKLSENKERKKI